MAEQIRGDDAIPGGKLCTTPRQQSVLPPMPWISNSTSPAPSSRYATRSPCNMSVRRFAVSAWAVPGLPSSSPPHLVEGTLMWGTWKFLNAPRVRA